MATPKMLHEHVANQSHPFRHPEYMSLFTWEDFNYDSWQAWMGKNWSVSVYLTVIYVGLIFAGRQWMKNREPYRLRGPLILWNLGLAIFSIVGFVRTFPELVYLMREENGFHTSVCIRDKMHVGTVFWTLMMALTKTIELGDTAFIVLRKQPLILLHWYHHATVMLYCWYTYYFHDAAHRWFMTINLFVHSVMYSYYAIRAMGIKLPRNLAMCITFLQLNQMFFGVAVNGYALYMKSSEIECQTETFNILLALLMYATYAVLFGNFFNKAYVQKKKKFD
ncbi:unnamed protein product [Orchesella dallaii]|uniref:Elongation of very long chain fatty acids protein n=1 Tax=Orchesella dallaii TaxID=48710 RepID=A0ABP1QWI6_9HEXA